MGWLLQGNRQRSNDVKWTSPPSGTVKWEGEGSYAACSQQCCEQVVSCRAVHPHAVSARWQHYWLWLAVFPFYNFARHCIPIYALSSPIGLHCSPEASKLIVRPDASHKAMSRLTKVCQSHYMIQRMNTLSVAAPRMILHYGWAITLWYDGAIYALREAESSGGWGYQ